MAGPKARSTRQDANAHPTRTGHQTYLERLRGSIRIRTKDKLTFSAKIGTTEMTPEQIAENINTVLKRVEADLEQGSQNLRSVFVKTTMGPAVRLI